MNLTDTQILFIEEDLHSRGLTYHALQEEVLDHICCMVEIELENGTTFNIAYQNALDAFGNEQGFKNIQELTYTLLSTKSTIMKKVLLLISMLILGVVGNTPAAQLLDPPSISPFGENATYHITSSFGMRMHPVERIKKQHFGTDFKAPIGTPIVATSDGVVTYADFKKGYGNHVIIQHDEEYATLYAQLKEWKVKPGEKVKKGQVIGLSGNSGASTAPHLHYEVHKNGKRVNPEQYF